MDLERLLEDIAKYYKWYAVRIPGKKGWTPCEPGTLGCILDLNRATVWLADLIKKKDSMLHAFLLRRWELS